MANVARLEITFTDISDLGAIISFDYGNLGGTITVDEECYSVRSNPYQYTRGTTVTSQANTYLSALVADYAYTLNFGINGNTVLIYATDYDNDFSNWSASNGANVTFNYVEAVLPDPEFEITGTTVQAADTLNRNEYVRTNIAVANGIEPYDINTLQPKSGLTESELYIEYYRYGIIGTQLIININDGNNDIATTNYKTVDYFTLDSITTNYNGDGTYTVTPVITILSGDISTIREISIDNSNWYEKTSFSSVSPGTYTFYIRDNLGAIYTEEFTLEEITVDINKPEPYFDIVKANSLRCVNKTNFDCDNIANWDNALLSELFDNGMFPNIDRKDYNQLIADCDTIKTQINSNYDTISVDVLDCDNNIVLQPTVSLVKQNILLEDMRDCNFLQSDEGKIVVYFGGGSIYDPETSLENGSYTNYSLQLYPFAVNGNLFTITGTTNSNGSFEQLREYYDLDNGIWGIELDVTFAGDYTGICKTNYNEKDYNVHEFSLVGSSLDNKKIYHLEIYATDEDIRYDDVNWHSEPIYKLSSTIGTNVIDYHHSSNTAGLDFTTGIIPRLRIPCRFIKGSNNEESESFTTDYGKKIIQKTTITRNLELETDPIPFYLAEKIIIASGMDNVLINLVKFVNGETQEQEDLFDSFNPFVTVTRGYQQDDVVSIGEEIGIATQSKVVIGSSNVIAIGDNG
ncbi:MAG: hypothetical protein ACOWWH_12715 [Eubacteriaceae bacterium]